MRRRALYIASQEEREKHAERLRAGLRRMGADFAASICWGCNGTTQRIQTFTNGCGMGYSTTLWDCDICECEGLLQGNKPAPASVTEQVLNAN